MGMVPSSLWSSHGFKLVYNASGSEFCQSSRVVSYGVLECHTRAVTMRAATDVGVYSSESRTWTGCEGSDATLC